MSKKFGRAQKFTAIVPLAVLSLAWTASLAGVGGAGGLSASAARLGGGPPLPKIEVPAEALQSGGSVLGDQAVAAMGSVNTRGGTQQIAATTSTSAIPSTALAAYQRAESIINSADESCNLTWQLVAAIGRVESDHGRFGGSMLDSDGLAQPSIVGIALDGSGQTSRIPDTDGGRYDGDTTFDRAIGPMQFIPDTWASIGVDADNDGQRNPQDIDDAALGTAVYLCSGDDDLSTLSGQRDAIYRYNNSESYVDLVLAIAAAYLDGDFSSVPDNTVAAGTLTPIPTAPAASGPSRTGDAGGSSTAGAGSQDDANRSGGGSGGSGGGSSNGDGGSGGGGDTTPSSPAPAPADPGGGGGSGGAGGGAGNTAKNTVKGAVKGGGDTVKDTVKGGGDTVGGVVGGTTKALTPAAAAVACVAKGLVDNPLNNNDAFDQCVADLTS